MCNIKYQQDSIRKLLFINKILILLKYQKTTHVQQEITLYKKEGVIHHIILEKIQHRFVIHFLSPGGNYKVKYIVIVTEKADLKHVQEQERNSTIVTHRKQIKQEYGLIQVLDKVQYQYYQDTADSLKINNTIIITGLQIHRRGSINYYIINGKMRAQPQLKQLIEEFHILQDNTSSKYYRVKVCLLSTSVSKHSNPFNVRAATIIMTSLFQNWR
uniref:Uncharacterized protein n=1 Tax=Spironucleus salmonicida TaxID=348837 RepID=V6LD06_9EUKA|eukprot:EST42370.1 Hypothetical protein SS50377_18104 [Spironucleus salmonicida]